MFEQKQEKEREESLKLLSKYIKCASFAGLAVWILMYFFFFKQSDSEFTITEDYKVLMANTFLLGNILSGFVAWQLRETFVCEKIPLWLSISVLGLVFSMFISGFFGWHLRQNQFISVMCGFVGRDKAIIFGKMLLISYTTFFTALFCYFPLMKQELKRKSYQYFGQF